MVVDTVVVVGVDIMATTMDGDPAEAPEAEAIRHMAPLLHLSPEKHARNAAL